MSAFLMQGKEADVEEGVKVFHANGLSLNA